MLMFSFSHHYWLKNRAGWVWPCKRGLFIHVPGPWRRQRWVVQAGLTTGRLVGFTSVMTLPLLTLPSNPTNLQGKDGLSSGFSDFFSSAIPGTCLVSTAISWGRWVGYCGHLQMKERNLREVDDLYIAGLGFGSTFCLSKLQFSHQENGTRKPTTQVPVRIMEITCAITLQAAIHMLVIFYHLSWN